MNTGKLDHRTLLRLTDDPSTSGELAQHVNYLNRTLLARNKMVIICLYLSQKKNSYHQTVLKKGRGVLVLVPITVMDRHQPFNATAKNGSSFSVFNTMKFILKSAGINYRLKRWLLLTKYRSFFTKIPLLKGFYKRNKYFDDLNLQKFQEVFNEIITQYPIDLVCLHLINKQENVQLATIANKKKIPVVAQSHNPNEVFNEFLPQKLKSKVVNFAGQYERGVPKKFLSMFVPLGNGIDTSFFSPTCAGKIALPVHKGFVMLVGSFERRKGHLDACKAIKMLKGRGIALKLVLCGKMGPKEYMVEIQKYLKQYNLQNDVVISKTLSQAELREYYNAASVCVLPSFDDAIPRVMLESQAMETPVVAYDIGGIHQAVLNERTGYLIKKGNIKKLADRIEYLVTNSKMQKTMGKEGRNFVKQKFDIEKLAMRHEDFYIDVLKRY